MGKRRVRLWGAGERFINVDEDATAGATLGVDLKRADGSIVYESQLGSGSSGSSNNISPSTIASTLWSLILNIPANIVSLAALAGIGFATRITAGGEWANRVITGIGRINVKSGDGIGEQLVVTLNSGGNVTLNTGGNVTLNEMSDGNPVISLLYPVYVDATSSYQVLLTDDTVDASSGSFPITLCDATICEGKMINLKNSGTGIIPLETLSGQLIDGEVSGGFSLVQYENLQVQSDGSNWKVL